MRGGMRSSTTSVPMKLRTVPNEKAINREENAGFPVINNHIKLIDLGLAKFWAFEPLVLTWKHRSN